MSSGISELRRQSILLQTEELRRAIGEVDLLVAGTLSVRRKTCGRKNCRCSTDPAARHGPYYEWTRMKDGRFVNTMVTAEQAALLEQAIANYRNVQELLKRWHEVSAAEIFKVVGTAGRDSSEKQR
jgi:hypothetical protein